MNKYVYLGYISRDTSPIIGSDDGNSNALIKRYLWKRWLIHGKVDIPIFMIFSIS